MLSCSKTFGSYSHASIKTLLPNMVCFVALFHLKLRICPCISSIEINSLKCFHKQTGMTAGILPISVQQRQTQTNNILRLPSYITVENSHTAWPPWASKSFYYLLPLQVISNHHEAKQSWYYQNTCWEAQHAIVHWMNSLCLDGQLTFPYTKWFPVTLIHIFQFFINNVASLGEKGNN